jgi:hypothetical protein
MDTNNLINALSRDLQPVRRLQAPMLRATLLSFLAIIFVAGMIFILHGPRPDWAAVLQKPAAMFSDALMLTAGILTVLAAFTLSIPDTQIRKPVIRMLSFATIIWTGMCLYAAYHLRFHDIQAEFDSFQQSSACIKALIFMCAFPLAVSFLMAWRAAPIWCGWTGYALTLSIASFSALGMRFLCPNDAYGHLLLWHFMPVISLSALGSLLGKIIFRSRL